MRSSPHHPPRSQNLRLTHSSPSQTSAHLKDSLVEGVKYAATAVGAGFNNQLIEYIMLLQYARESGRVPILGDFLAASNPNIWSLKPVAPYMPFVRPTPCLSLSLAVRKS